MDTRNYGSSECGSTSGAVLDHSSTDVYVQLSGSSNGCTGIQSYKINTGGALGYLGATESGYYNIPSSVPKFASNNVSAYGIEGTGSYCDPWFSWFQRSSTGLLTYHGSAPRNDPSNPYYYGWSPQAITDDSSNHLAVALFGTDYYCDAGSTQLASYTVSSSGTISSTNSGYNMPYSNVGVTSMVMSPAGNIVAVAGNGNYTGSGTTATGLQLFHFNAGAPITPYSSVLTSAPIDQIRWDKANHLYALSKSQGKLYVWTVTSTSISVAPGSPHTFSTPEAVVVH